MVEAPRTSSIDSSKTLHRIFWVILALMVGMVWWLHCLELSKTLAVSAQAPWPMVDRWLDPELQTLDPSCHADELQQSLYMRGFLLAEVLGIDRTVSMAFSLLLGFAAVAYASVVLVRSFSPKASPAAWLLFAMWNLATVVPKVDLANFGGGLTGLGQMYEPALACGLLAIAAVLRRSWITFGCFVAIGALCHIVVAFQFAAVAVAIALPSVRREDLPRFSMGMLIAMVVSGGWALGVATQMPEQMSKSDWMRFARFGNSHWFPFDFGIFGKLHYWSGATIYLSILLCGMASVRLVASRPRRTQWWFGVLASLVLTVVGLAATLIGDEPALIKLAFHRASAVATQLSMLVVVLFLVETVRSRSVGAYLAIFVVLFATVHGLGPLITVLALVVIFMRSPAGTRWIPIVALGMFLAWVISVWLRGHIGIVTQITHGTSRSSSWSAWMVMLPGSLFEIPRNLKLVVILVAWLVACGVKKMRDREDSNRAHGTLVMLGFVAVFTLANASTVAWSKIQDRSTGGRDCHGDFLAAQLWASENTAPRSLFFVDPVDEYGFREYSSRPTFGTPREWVHTSFLYGGSAARFEEGQRKSRLFGVEPGDFMESGSTYAAYIAYRGAIREAIHSKDPAWFEDLAQREGLDYIVMRVENSNLWSNLDPVYENESYRIHAFGP